MMHRLLHLSLLMCLALGNVTLAEEPPQGLIKELAVLEPLLGKTYRGEFANSTKEKPMVDVQTWERILNGRGVRLMHSLNNGEYGGETIFMWEPEQKKIAYWYFTTAGFTTKGTVEVSGRQWTTMEEVSGSANGISKVRGTTSLADDGTLHVKTEYFAKDQWSPGTERVYKPTPDAKVIFK